MVLPHICSHVHTRPQPVRPARRDRPAGRRGRRPRLCSPSAAFVTRCPFAKARREPALKSEEKEKSQKKVKKLKNRKRTFFFLKTKTCMDSGVRTVISASDPGARWQLCREGGHWGPPGARGRGRPSAGRTRSGLLRKLAAPVREAAAGPRGLPSRGRCWMVRRDGARAAPSAWRPHAVRRGEGPRPFQRPPETAPAHPGDRFLNQPCEGVEAAGGRAAGHSAHTPAAQGARAALPRPPKRSRLFVCLGDFRKRRAGLSGYWYCFFTP